MNTNTKLKSATISLLENNIIQVETTADYEASIDDIKEINNETSLMAADQKYLILVLTNQGASATSEAREYAAKESVRKNLIAEAIVIKNIALRLAATVYMKVNRPKQRIKLFNSKNEALKWLREIRAKEIND